MNLMHKKVIVPWAQSTEQFFVRYHPWLIWPRWVCAADLGWWPFYPLGFWTGRLFGLWRLIKSSLRLYSWYRQFFFMFLSLDFKIGLLAKKGYWNVQCLILPIHSLSAIPGRTTNGDLAFSPRVGGGGRSTNSRGGFAPRSNLLPFLYTIFHEKGPLLLVLWVFLTENTAWEPAFSEVKWVRMSGMHIECMGLYGNLAERET